MSTGFYTHPIFLEHDAGAHHPERPDRLRAIYRALDGERFALLQRCDCPRAEVKDLVRVHKRFYVEDILYGGPREGYRHLDPDTAMSPASAEAALRAAGGVCAAVDAVIAGEMRNAFCAVRPPGHHAEINIAQGFCLFNNVAVAARHARAVHGIGRVAVVDFDVHHGNGTQNDFWYEPELFYASSHQSPGYPGSGASDETGVEHNICNVILPPGSKPDVFRAAYTDTILPKLRAFGPELLIVSAGFDADARDPLAYLRLRTEDFEWVTRELVAVADDCCNGRLVSALEGGYDLEALGAGVAAHLRVLMGN